MDDCSQVCNNKLYCTVIVYLIVEIIYNCTQYFNVCRYTANLLPTTRLRVYRNNDATFSLCNYAIILVVVTFSLVCLTERQE